MSATVITCPALTAAPDSVSAPAVGRLTMRTAASAFAGASFGSVKPKCAVVNVSGVSSFVLTVLLVPAGSPFKTVADVLAQARANPGKLNYASAGVGSSQHLAGARFVKLANVDIPHIPYKGTAPAMTDVMAGRVDMVLTTGAVSFVRSGKVRALAVASKERLPALPDVPTFDEAGLKGFHPDAWYGLVAPAGTPPLARLLSRSSFLLNEVAVRNRAAQLMPDDVVDVLPPFAGG